MLGTMVLLVALYLEAQYSELLTTVTKPFQLLVGDSQAVNSLTFYFELVASKNFDSHEMQIFVKMEKANFENC